jgi:hypothetical protein
MMTARTEIRCRRTSVLAFRVHSGWAAALALGGRPDFPELIERTRLNLIDCDGAGVAQPYHAAAEMDIAEVEVYIELSAQSSTAIAREALEALLVRQRAKNRGVGGCAILFASGRQLGALASILASHAMIHTAEGEFFRNVIVQACEQLDLRVTRIKERELWSVAEEAVGFPSERLQSHLAVIGKIAGPPWTQDQKLAALAAWVALVTKGK